MKVHGLKKVSLIWPFLFRPCTGTRSMSRLAKNWPFFASDPKAKEIKKPTFTDKSIGTLF